MDNKDRRERFIRVAEARTNKIINLIQLLGNCSNRSNYDFTQKDIEKIFSVIEDELKSTKKKFVSSNNTKVTKFKL